MKRNYTPFFDLCVIIYPCRNLDVCLFNLIKRDPRNYQMEDYNHFVVKSRTASWWLSVSVELMCPNFRHTILAPSLEGLNKLFVVGTNLFLFICLNVFTLSITYNHCDWNPILLCGSWWSVNPTYLMKLLLIPCRYRKLERRQPWYWSEFLRIFTQGEIWLTYVV